MGSTGSGSFSDYPGSRPKDGAQGGGGGGASGDDRCARAFSSPLEEVEHCDYFSANGDVPPANTTLSIEQRGRLFAVDASGQTVGALPVGFNYLADCMAAGFAYEGRINASASAPIAFVSADFAPRRT
jgi:hypothetical protein